MNFRDAMLPQVVCSYGTGSRTATSGFAPRFLDHNRLPFLVQYMEDLPERMKKHLLELLESDPFRPIANRPASQDVRNAYGNLIRECQRRNQGNFVTTEPDVRELASKIADPVKVLYDELTGGVLHSPPEIHAVDKGVKTDRVFR